MRNPRQRPPNVIVPTLVAVLALAPLAVTAETDPTRTEADFGNSVRHMINSQIHDPKAASQPGTEPADGLDGNKADAALKIYRKDASNPDSVDRPIVLQTAD